MSNVDLKLKQFNENRNSFGGPAPLDLIHKLIDRNDKKIFISKEHFSKVKTLTHWGYTVVSIEDPNDIIEPFVIDKHNQEVEQTNEQSSEVTEEE